MRGTVLWALSWAPVAISVNQTIGQLTWVRGSSMRPSLNPDSSLGAHDLLVLKKYGLRKPGGIVKGDVLVFRSPMDAERIMVKRVLGTAGDTVRPRPTSTYPKKQVKIPANHVWLEGDNVHSIDSNTFGPVSTGLVIGKAVQVIYPFSRWGQVSAGGREDAVVQPTEYK